MKLTPFLITMACICLGALTLPSADALTPAEQANAFYTRGLTAERRGDFLAAGNCYALTLRLSPSHAEALARIADMEQKNVTGTEARSKAITLPFLRYDLLEISPMRVGSYDPPKRESEFRETLALLNRLTGLNFSLEMAGHSIQSHEVDLKDVTVFEALKQISSLAGLTVSYERDVIRLTAKDAPVKSSDPIPASPPAPKLDFTAWLKTVQLVHVTGNKFTINDDEVLQLNPSAGLARFKPFTIDPENRTVTWERPTFTAKLTVAADLKSFQYAHKTEETDVKGNRVEPRDPAIFDGKPASQPAPAPVSVPKPVAPKSEAATLAQPLENSLGMKFVPVPGRKVLFCIHETRRQDYAAFAAAVPDTDETWKTAQLNGIPCGEQDDHPVVGVSRDDGRKFCAWLSRKEGRVYRLPTDEEWSLAVGVAAYEIRTAESTPELLNMEEKTQFPWGDSYPPQSGKPVGNYADTKWRETFPAEGVVEGYTDGFATTAPVMSFPANSFGLFDLGGNVWEWINEPWQGIALSGPVVRGAAFNSSGKGNLLSSRRSRSGNPRPPDAGFRVVLDVK